MGENSNCTYLVWAYEPTMMLLIGIWINLTKNPINPIIQKPMAVAMAIFWNSFLSGFVHRLIRRILSFANWRPGSVSFFTWSIMFVQVV